MDLVRACLGAQNALVGALVWTCFRRPDPTRDPDRVLILRVGALGDFLFAVPAIRLIRGRFPGAHISLLSIPTTNPAAARFISRYTHGAGEAPWAAFVTPALVDEVIGVSASSGGAVLAAIRHNASVRNASACFLLLNPGEHVSGILKKLALLRAAGFKGEVHGWRARANNRYFRRTQQAAGGFEHHVVAASRALSDSPYGAAPSAGRLDNAIEISDAARMFAQRLWQTQGWDERTVIALAPGSVQPHKRWPSDRFAELCRRLATEFEPVYLIVGAENDAHAGRELIAASIKRVHIVAGTTTLMESAAILERCRLLIGNDGGAMHLGAAAGCRCVSLIPGLEFPDSVEPWGNQEWAVRHPVPCSPCYSFTQCPEIHNACMMELPVERVVELCQRALRSTGDDDVPRAAAQHELRAVGTHESQENPG